MTGSNTGAGVLAAFGAAGGAALALTVMYVLGRLWIDPWLNSLPERDTDMFGRPEGWVVAILTALFGPPIVVVSAWLAMQSACRTWDLDEISPNRLWFVLLALVLGTLSLSALDVLGTAGGLVVVALAVGIAGFVSSTRASTRGQGPIT